MKTCEKCGKFFPYKIKIDGKERNLQRRKYCLECSPFLKHNTKQLDRSIALYKKSIGICIICGKNLPESQKKGQVCYTCSNYNRRKRIQKRIHDILGYSCWKCGYTVSTQNALRVLHFHHMDPLYKCFELGILTLSGKSWDKVVLELKKCVLLCANCHMEYHSDCYSSIILYKIYEEKWKNIVL